MTLAQCPSVLAIHNDVFIYRKNDRDHNANIINLFNVAQKEGLVFKSKKCAIKQGSVTFFGRVFLAEGYSPDPEKIQGISKMTPPQMKQELQSFLGAVNYLQTFVPHLSSNTEPLWALLKKENCFTWDENTNTCFQKIKSQLQKALLRPLRYYDQTKLVTLQCDASLKGLGACIIQDGQPIVFASKSLTDTKTHYANIERELLAIIYGCEKFHMYLYGRTFVMETDHKPLEMISLKNLTAAPACLQRMLLHLQQYDLVITYQPGREMLLADALSCLPSRTYIKQCLTCIKSSNLLVETLQPHMVPPGPWIKIGVDFFQDHLGKKHLIVADYFSKFPYVFPVASTHHFKTITHLRELFAAEGVPTIIISDNRPPFNGEEFRQFSHDFDFVHTTSSPHFHQSNGFIEAMVKKVKNAYKKMDGSPNAQARALLQLHDTPIMADLPSPAEILHGRPAQGTVLSRPSKRVNIHQIRQRLVELQEKQKEQFDRAHRAKDLHPLKVKE